MSFRFSNCEQLSRFSKIDASCEQLSKPYVFEEVEFFPTEFKDGMRLKARQLEKTEIEFKGLGKLIRRNKLAPHNNWDDFKHQAPELEMQIAAMLNTNGGKIYLGVAKNGVILGGDYTYEDKENLLCFLKNLTVKLKISGQGLIEDPKFIDIPYEFVSTLPNGPNSTRCLVVLKIKPASEVVYLSKKIFMRELGGVVTVDYKTWFNRRNLSRTFKPDAGCLQPMNKYKCIASGVEEKTIPKQRGMSYAQIVAAH